MRLLQQKERLYQGSGIVSRPFSPVSIVLDCSFKPSCHQFITWQKTENPAHVCFDKTAVRP